jgi:hypothetical protein
MRTYRISRFEKFNETRMNVYRVSGITDGEHTTLDILASTEEDAMERATTEWDMTEVHGASEVDPEEEFDEFEEGPLDEKRMFEGENRHQNYMFFQNLNTIKEAIMKLEQLNPEEVDNLISDGHDWVSDHMSTSKDDVEEVCQFLCARLSGHK